MKGAWIANTYYRWDALVRMFGPQTARMISGHGMLFIEQHYPLIAEFIYDGMRSMGVVSNPRYFSQQHERLRARLDQMRSIGLKREANTTMELPRSVAQRTDASPAPAFPQLTLPTTTSAETSSAAATSLRSSVSSGVRNMQTPARTTSAQPLKVIQTVAAPSSKKSYSRRRGNTGITFDLARILYPVLNTSASRGNFLMGLDCNTVQNATSSIAPNSSFVSCGSAWDINSNHTATTQTLGVLTYLWGCGVGRGINSSTGLPEAKTNMAQSANEFAINYGIYSLIGADFMPVPKLAGTVSEQPNSGNMKSNAPYLEIYGRSWYGDPYHASVTSTVMYPDFKFCAQGCAMREYKTPPAPFNTVPNALQSYAGLQGVLELDGMLQGNQICILAQMAYDNSTLGRRIENPSTFYVDSKDQEDSKAVRVFDSDAINDSAQAVWLSGTTNMYTASDAFWRSCHSVGGLDLPFMYDIKDTLHFANAMDVPIVVNVEIFECSDNIEHRTPYTNGEFLRFNEMADIMPQWQMSLNDKADNTANNNGFYGGMSGTTAPTAKAERIYDVGRTADGAKNVKRYWKCVGKKHFKLESLQELSHTFHKYDVVNMKNVVDRQGEGLDKGVVSSSSSIVDNLPKMNLDRPTSIYLDSQITPPDNTKIGTHLVETKEKIISTSTSYIATDVKTHVDRRIKKYVKGHSYKYIITWFGLKQMANDSNGANPPNPPFNDGIGPEPKRLDSFPDSAYIRNGRAQLVVSRSIDAQMRVGPGTKKALVQQQRFGPVGEHTGVFSKDGTIDLDLVGNGFTRAAANPDEINPIPRVSAV